jgi:enterochelin esterase-like enzyme
MLVESADTPKRAHHRPLGGRDRAELIGPACVFALLLAACSASTPLAPSPIPSASPTHTLTVTPEPSATPRPSLTPSPPTATATPACAGLPGQVIQGSYRSPVLQEPVPVRIYLPPCYGEIPSAYPALYVLHGYPYDESHWDQLKADEIADEHIRDGSWPPFLIIMPRQPQPLLSHTDGGPGSYEEEMLEGLIPFIDHTFSTVAKPAARGIAGISRGGVWALEIGFRHPELFGSIAALSPALSVNSARPEYDPLQIAAQGPLPQGRILLLAGQDDWAKDSTTSLAETLAARGQAATLLLPPGAHIDSLWKSSMQEVLRFFAGVWLRTK